MTAVSWCCGRIQSPNDVIQNNEKTLNTIATPQHATEPTIVSATPRNILHDLQQKRKWSLKLKIFKLIMPNFFKSKT